jgi:hypothetical protein
MARFGEEHASPSEVWLSPNARDEPPSDPGGVIRIARKRYLKNSILRDSAIEQKRQAEDHNERGREPRSERGSACRYDQNPGGVSGMADEGVGSRESVLAIARAFNRWRSGLHSANAINCTTSLPPGSGMRLRWEQNCLSKRIGSSAAAMPCW